MLFPLFWPSATQIAVAKEPLKQLQKLLYILAPADAFVSQVQITGPARLRSLIMDSEGDLGERGSLEINDRCCCWCGKVQRSILLVPDSSERHHVRDVFDKFMLFGRLKNQRIRTEIEWRLQVFGVFWMHCCELQVHSLTTNRVAEHGDSWALILFCCKWAKAQEGVTSHWHAFTPAALSASSALFSWWMIDIHGIFQMVSSCFLEV